MAREQRLHARRVDRRLGGVDLRVPLEAPAGARRATGRRRTRRAGSPRPPRGRRRSSRRRRPARGRISTASVSSARSGIVTGQPASAEKRLATMSGGLSSGWCASLRLRHSAPQRVDAVEQVARLVDRVDGAAVAPARVLLLGVPGAPLDGHRAVDRAAAGGPDLERARLGDDREVGRDAVARAGEAADAAGLLVGVRADEQVARDAAGRGDRLGRDDHRCDPALHVARPAPAHAPVRHPRLERIVLPAVLARRRHDVDVPVEEERARAARPGNRAAAAGAPRSRSRRPGRAGARPRPRGSAPRPPRSAPAPRSRSARYPCSAASSRAGESGAARLVVSNAIRSHRSATSSSERAAIESTSRCSSGSERLGIRGRMTTCSARVASVGSGAVAEPDYIIVGAGSAGCVLANRLSEDPSVRVLLIEAGGTDRHPNIKIPAAFAKQFHTKLDWDFATEPEPHVRRALALHPAREGARRLELDERDALRARPPARLRPVGASRARRAGAGTTSCPTSCAPRTTSAAPPSSTAPAGRCASTSSARRAPLDRRAARGQRGRRHPAHRRLQRPRAGRRRDVPGHAAQRRALQRRRRLPAPGAARPNLEVRTGALVLGIELDGGARSASASPARARRRARCAPTREVILCAGAIDSPQLLLLCGIGPPGRAARRGRRAAPRAARRRRATSRTTRS